MSDSPNHHTHAVLANPPKAKQQSTDDDDDDCEEALMQEEINGTPTVTGTGSEYDVAPAHTSAAARNAFTELMSSASKHPSSSAPFKPSSVNRARHPLNAAHGRDALRAYTSSPTAFPSSIIISHDANFVAIHDAFPKASVHLLLLPRDETKQLLHPFEALADADFLASVRTEAGRLRKLAASELRRKFGRFSALDAERNAALDLPPPSPPIASSLDTTSTSTSSATPATLPTLPSGRDWEKDIRVGVHAVPSMTHLHIHIVSVDKFSPCLKDRRHYNSFSTPFFVPLDDFPLAPDDERWHSGEMRYLDWSMTCWRCGQDFSNRFKRLKAHLEEEFESWKRI